MLGGTELRALSTWCGQRDLSWYPAECEGVPVMMLQPRDPSRPWQRMMLVLGAGELRLDNELGETLASASDLPALLDAVEGGVAEVATPRSAAVRRPRSGKPLPGFIL